MFSKTNVLSFFCLFENCKKKLKEIRKPKNLSISHIEFPLKEKKKMVIKKGREEEKK